MVEECSPCPLKTPTVALKLADWLELVALLSSDSNASSGDLQSALRVAAIDDLTEDEDIERKTLEVFSELEARERAAGEGYPFTLSSPQVLQSKLESSRYAPYIFCLCLS